MISNAMKCWYGIGEMLGLFLDERIGKWEVAEVPLVLVIISLDSKDLDGCLFIRLLLIYYYFSTIYPSRGY